MLKSLSILYTSLWYIIAIVIYIGISREPTMFALNALFGSVFALVGVFHTMKVLRLPVFPDDTSMISYKNLEIVSLVVQIIFLLFIMTGAIYRVFSEGFSVFG